MNRKKISKKYNEKRKLEEDARLAMNLKTVRQVH